jgi:pimeloyl-ACP methyl ester carboxylesterase
MPSSSRAFIACACLAVALLPVAAASMDGASDPGERLGPPPAVEASMESHESPPVLLIYGFQPVPGFYPPQLWAEVAEELTERSLNHIERLSLDAEHSLYFLSSSEGRGRDVFFSDYAMPYEPTVRDLRFYAARLSDEIAWITSNENVGKVDLVAFSMGALVARCYIEASDFGAVLGGPEYEDYDTVYRGDVRTLITIAAPHHGAEFAALGPWFGPLPRQLDPESSFLAILNEGAGDEAALHTDVRYVSMAGQSCLGFGCSVRSDVDVCRRECVEEGLEWAGHDLVILMSSAYLPGAANIACIGLDHIDMRTHPSMVEAVERLLNSEPVADAIYASTELENAGSGN